MFSICTTASAPSGRGPPAQGNGFERSLPPLHVNLLIWLTRSDWQGGTLVPHIMTTVAGDEWEMADFWATYTWMHTIS